MGLFRKRIELSEKEMNEFIQTMAEQSQPRYAKRREWDQREKREERVFDKSSNFDEGNRFDEEDSFEESMVTQKDDTGEEPGNERENKDIHSSVITGLKGMELRNYLEERCENIMEGGKQIASLRKEYQEVTRYLQDTQLIDRADESQRERLMDAARHILALKKEDNGVNRRKSVLTDYQYKTMEQYSDIIPKEIVRLEEEEEYRALIKSDLQKLEGEKGALIYEEEELHNKHRFLNRISLVAGVLTILLFVLYLVLYFYLKAEVTVPFLITALGALLMTAYVFYEGQHNRYAAKMNEKKRNRLIMLQNRVKIKYVNNTASLDYSYDKYGVNHSKELRHRWELYVEQVERMERQQQNREALRYYELQLYEVLEELGLHDVEIWAHQAEAIVDRREMVEIRHRLNSRRGKLRERLEYNTRLKEEAENELRQFRQLRPEERERLQAMLRSYGVTI